MKSALDNRKQKKVAFDTIYPIMPKEPIPLTSYYLQNLD